MLLQVGLDGGTERTGTFAVNNGNLLDMSEDGVVDKGIQDKQRFICRHAAKIAFCGGAAPGNVHSLPDRALSVAPHAGTVELDLFLIQEPKAFHLDPGFDNPSLNQYISGFVRRLENGALLIDINDKNMKL